MDVVLCGYLVGDRVVRGEGISVGVLSEELDVSAGEALHKIDGIYGGVELVAVHCNQADLRVKGELRGVEAFFGGSGPRVG